MSNSLARRSSYTLPDVMDNTLPSIGNILSSFGLPREVIASNEEIACAWRELPRLRLHEASDIMALSQ